METIFTIPDMKTVSKVVADADAVQSRRPLLIMKGGSRKRMPSAKKRLTAEAA